MRLGLGLVNKNLNIEKMNQRQYNKTVILIFRIPIQYPIKTMVTDIKPFLLKLKLEKSKYLNVILFL